jgi:excisionase family DNA binding protein
VDARCEVAQLHSGSASPADPDLMTQTFEPLLSDAQAGELLGLHPKTVQRLARAGELPAVRIGRYWRFRATALNLWIDVHSTGQPLTERLQ